MFKFLHNRRNIGLRTIFRGDVIECGGKQIVVFILKGQAIMEFGSFPHRIFNLCLYVKAFMLLFVLGYPSLPENSVSRQPPKMSTLRAKYQYSHKPWMDGCHGGQSAHSRIEFEIRPISENGND